MKQKGVLLLLMMALALFPAAPALSEASLISFDAAYDPALNAITISGAVSSGSGQAVTIRVIYPDGTQYVNQLTSGEDGSFVLSYTLRQAVPGTYRVLAGGSGAAAPVVREFVIAPGGKEEPEPGTGGGTGPAIGGGSPASAPVRAVVDGNVISVEAMMENGLAVASFGEEVLDRLNYAADAVVVEVGMPQEASALRLNVPAALFHAAAEAQQPVEIRTPLAALMLAPEALSHLELEGDTVIALDIALAALPEGAAEAAEAIGNRPVYDFRMTAGDRPVHDFNGRLAVRIALPYAPEPGEREEAVVVYHISEDGELVLIRNGAYDPGAGAVVFHPPHFSLYAAAYRPAVFSDLDEAPWAESHILSMAARGILDGVGNGAFAPNEPVTRAAFVEAIVAAAELADNGETGDAAGAAGAFSDVPQQSPYAEAVSLAAQRGIVHGYGDGRFLPLQPLTREEMFTIAARALRAAGDSLQAVREPVRFRDEDQIASFAAEAIRQLSAAGMIEGRGGGKLAPKEYASRAEAAALLHKVQIRLFGLN